MNQFVGPIALELSLKPFQVENTIGLLEEKNTVPFITRYRKEVTGGLQEDEIRAVQERFEYHTTMEDRRQKILESIESQGKLTPELEKKIRSAVILKTLEDLYLPYRPKKRTLATIAKERGLGPLGEEIWAQELDDSSFLTKVQEAINPEKDLPSQEDVLTGLQHLLAEKISEKVEVREDLRKTFREEGLFVTSPSSKEEEKGDTSDYFDYFDFSQPMKDLPPHRILAINRGEKEGALKVVVEVPEDKILQQIARRVIHSGAQEVEDLLWAAEEDSFKRLLYPSLCREIRSDLTEVAEAHAIEIFSKNLRQLLLSPPVRGKRVLGVDPGFRSGCKLASVDEFGNLLEVGVMFPHAPQKQSEKSKAMMLAQIQKHNLQLVAIGNGTAHRETEELVSDLIHEGKLDLEYTIVSEAGASVYSASKEAQDEFPELEASYRGTISIARRLQDPLAEIVKIDPKSMGVGMYQHDVNPRALSKAVDQVVESCVNYVGVDLNTASVSLLKYVSGLNRLQARRIYEHRQKQGAFRSRDELLKVRGIGENAFIQSAGFLRIPEGTNPLDNTQIHPESYEKTNQLLREIQIPSPQLGQASGRSMLEKALKNLSLSTMAQKLEMGLPTLQDIVENLKKPGRDPRDELPKPAFRKGIIRLEDLQLGMEFQGTVRNVIDFGAFVDIGVKEDGLVHISQMSDQFVKNPLDVVKVGDVVKVRILKVDLQRKRIGLTMKSQINPQDMEGGRRKSPGKKGKKNPPKSSKSQPEWGTLGAIFKRDLGDGD